jgi:hypothetical protein
LKKINKESNKVIIIRMENYIEFNLPNDKFYLVKEFIEKFYCEITIKERVYYIQIRNENENDNLNNSLICYLHDLLFDTLDVLNIMLETNWNEEYYSIPLFFKEKKFRDEKNFTIYENCSYFEDHELKNLIHHFLSNN